ncbi:protein of unknown function DUF1538 [Sulfuricella denitrificans skB26]|uniref:DUF1538 domain-containing protein n=1 Tax=Sulfuricella denitrificans (strain DSM 22764 / NBRC 105220 / skB26) TaxID=1163617 RepID=S6A9L7_SULDS|nr:DUF1538 domain-containing protein [Sulfuricella denitrificans]BAN34330.1 protein of unknown function DUF1538 [Sulfuricella denitrificans skB26]
MNTRIRYGDYLGAVRHRQHAISYNVVTAHGPSRRRMRLRVVDVYRLIGPYVGLRFFEQVRAVVPLAMFMVLFLLVVLHVQVANPGDVALGLVGIMVGLMLFIEGVKHGLMPFSENIGYIMPGRSSLMSVALVAFALGAAATLAEPAIGALKAAGSLTSAEASPQLYSLLHDRVHWLVFAVAIGVGLAVLVGILRFYFNWRLKTILLIIVPPCLMLTAYLASDPRLAPILGLAWDCGAVTTGPVTVPLVLAVGIGVSAATGREDNPLSGFGIVTLASLFPVMSVMLLGLFVEWGWMNDISIESLVATATSENGFQMGPFADITLAVRAILPLVLFLWVVQRFLLKEKQQNLNIVVYGVLLAILGMALFSVGLDYGLTELGTQAGEVFPAAFSRFESVPDSPLYSHGVGITLTLLFALLLGFGATLAEPALNAMGMTVQELTDGAFTKNTLIRAVAFGVGIGTTIGVCKIIFNLPIAWLLLPSYVLALFMTLFSGEEYVNLAWDSAGVTTGPVTVPLVLALGLGLGKAVGVQDGFGILAMASVGPIISVLAVGLWIRMRTALNRRARVIIE